VDKRVSKRKFIVGYLKNEGFDGLIFFSEGRDCPELEPVFARPWVLVYLFARLLSEYRWGGDKRGRRGIDTKLSRVNARPCADSARDRFLDDRGGDGLAGIAKMSGWGRGRPEHPWLGCVRALAGCGKSPNTPQNCHSGARGNPDAVPSAG
jgi:hypothetical protein